MSKTYKIMPTAEGEYSASKLYDELSEVQGQDGLYRSKKDGNIGHPLTDTTWWAKVIDLTPMTNAVSAAVSQTNAAKAISDGVVSAEQSRVSAESARATAESTRSSNEQSRQSNEQSRQSAESGRVSAESSRVSAESARVSAEQSRATAEDGRVATFNEHEQSRQTAESGRVSAESSRVSAESARVNAEAARVTAENTRVVNEKSRETAFAGMATTINGKVDKETGKGLIDPAPVDGKVYGRKNGAWVESVDESLAEKVDDLDRNKADKNGHYEGMSCAMAENLIGKGNATEQTFTERTAGGGASIEDGVAEYRKVKGNSIVWNQQTYFSSSSQSQGGISWTGNGGEIVISGSCSSMITPGLSNRVKFIEGHKFLCITDMPSIEYGQGEDSYQMTYYNGNVYLSPTELRFSAIANKVFYINSKIAVDAFIHGRINKDSVLNKKYYCQFIDLTRMFGAGKEPTTIAEFNARKPIVDDEYAYTEGEIVNFNAKKVVTTKADGSDGHELNVDPTTILDSDGQQLFPYGLCKAGDVYDEITKDGAVKRMGKRTYQSGDESNTSYVTDGTNTLYPLATPVSVTFADERQTDIEVFANGTEKIVVAEGGKSTPIVADVNYGIDYPTTIDRLHDEVGNASDLTTMAKNTLVAAINEVNGTSNNALNDAFVGIGAAQILIAEKLDITADKVGVKVFDGTEDWLYFNNCFYDTHDVIFGRKFESKKYLSNYYLATNPSTSVQLATDKTFMAFSTADGIVFRDDSISQNANAWKSHLAALYASGTPLVVFYEKA